MFLALRSASSSADSARLDLGGAIIVVLPEVFPDFPTGIARTVGINSAKIACLQDLGGMRRRCTVSPPSPTADTSRAGTSTAGTPTLRTRHAAGSRRSVALHDLSLRIDLSRAGNEYHERRSRPLFRAGVLLPVDSALRVEKAS